MAAAAGATATSVTDGAAKRDALVHTSEIAGKRA